jgi:hypothetical protein
MARTVEAIASTANVRVYVGKDALMRAAQAALASNIVKGAIALVFQSKVMPVEEPPVLLQEAVRHILRA